MAFEVSRVVAVICILASAAFMVSGRSKLPLALRGLGKVLDSGRPGKQSGTPPPATPRKRRLAAFLLVIAAIVLALV